MGKTTKQATASKAKAKKAAPAADTAGHVHSRVSRAAAAAKKPAKAAADTEGHVLNRVSRAAKKIA
jgi:hypothetical protein